MARVWCECVEEETGRHVMLEYELVKAPDGRGWYYYLQPTGAGINLCRLHTIKPASHRP